MRNKYYGGTYRHQPYYHYQPRPTYYTPRYQKSPSILKMVLMMNYEMSMIGLKILLRAIQFCTVLIGIVVLAIVFFFQKRKQQKFFFQGYPHQEF